MKSSWKILRNHLQPLYFERLEKSAFGREIGGSMMRQLHSPPCGFPGSASYPVLKSCSVRFLAFGMLAVVSACAPEATGQPETDDIRLDKGFTLVVNDSENKALRENLGILNRDINNTLGKPADVRFQTTPPEDLTNAVIVINEEAGGMEGFPRLEGFERHKLYEKDGNLILHGADELGTIFALYEFSKQFLGVAPLWYWASLQPEPMDEIRVPNGFVYDSGVPSVRYRAWFPNDQDMFSPWRKMSDLNNEILYETMLRLKVNTIEIESTINYSRKGNIERLPKLINQYGLYITFHHHTALASRMRDWNKYRELMGQEPVKEYMIADLPELEKFWRYNVRTLRDNGIDKVIWTVNFRGEGDRPFWLRRNRELVADAPESMEDRAALMNSVVARQAAILEEEHGGTFPLTRITLYDEVSDLLAAGLLQPPAEENLIWNYVAARRDHFPNDDLRDQEIADDIKLGYYMNLQFTSTGSHMAQAEGPWKMEKNYRYVDSKNAAPIEFSVVNAGNIREHVLTLSANAAMLWDMEGYRSDKFLVDFCRDYFGANVAEEAAALYRDFFHAYWEQKKPDIPEFDRQYIFHDLRYKQAVRQLSRKFFSPVNMNLLEDYAHEQLPNRTFRIVPEDSGHCDQVSALIAGTKISGDRFAEVASRADELMPKIDPRNRPFFNDNLRTQANFMAHLNRAVSDYFSAYVETDAAKRGALLVDAVSAAQAARESLRESAHSVFATWYDEENIFDLDDFVATIEKTLRRVQGQDNRESAS
jgi:deoxyadenosine/deoxycytidine kinase